MRYKTPTTLLRLTACLASVALLASCYTFTDPSYEAVKNSIPDTDYPATQIAGQWLGVVGFKEKGWEVKEYLELRRDGTGQRRLIVFENKERRRESTADLKWSYLGKNRWSIMKVLGSHRELFIHNRVSTTWAGVNALTGIDRQNWITKNVYRLVPPRLYDCGPSENFFGYLGASYVPLDNEALVRALHQEHR
jgi:hypothetical protein